MKKKLLSLTLAVVFLFVGICPAFAEVLPASTGFYNIGSAAGITIDAFSGQTPVESSSVDVDGDGTKDTYYRNSDRFSVSLSGVTSGYEYTISLVEGKNAPSENSTYYYVNQVTSTSTTVNFSVVPKLPEKTTDLALYISSNQPGFSPRLLNLGFAHVAPIGDAPTFASAPVVTVGTTYATVEYSATAGDAPITSYIIMLNGEVYSTVDAAQTSQVIMGLTTGTTYTLSVIAVSAYGNTESQTVTFVPGTKPTFTATPSVVVGNGTATISFSATASGSPITSYQIKLNNAVVATLDASATSYIFEGLSNGTTYNATVVAINAVGSTESTAVNFTPVDGTASVTVSGTATSFINDTDSTKIELYTAGAASAAYTASVTGKSATYSIPNVVAGTYTMKVSKTNHVTREYTITVGGTSITQNVTIHPLGDINGDGTLNLFDSGKIGLHRKSKSLLTDYSFLCGDIDGNGTLNLFDSGKVGLHRKSKAFLW